MAPPHRIIIADSSTRTLQVVRAALDLLERPAVIIEAPTADAALAELGRGKIDLVVIASDSMRGFELALKAKKASADTPVLVLAGAGDPEVDDQTRQDSPFYYVVRAEKGEQFVYILRALLDGEEIVDPAVQSAAPTSSLGPVPGVNIKALGDVLSSMLTDVGAMAVVLADRQGVLLSEFGAVGYLDRERLVGVLGPIFANMAHVGPLVGGPKPRAMNFYDGDEFDIFALSVGYHYFACLIFEGSAGARAFGAVTMFGRRAVEEMLDIIGDTAFRVQIVEAKAAVKPAETRKEARKGKEEKAKAPEPPPEPAPVVQEYVPPRSPALEPLPDDVDLEKMLSGLEKLDLAQADELFDPTKLAEIAAQSMAGERLTFEEAQQMGVLQK